MWFVVGCLLTGVAATSVAAALRLRGVVAFVLGVGVLAAGEIVALSHLLSRFGAYERGWMLVALTVVAGVSVGTMVAVGPRWPTLPRAALKTLASDRLLVALSAVVLLELAYLASLAIFTAPVERDALAYHLARALFWIQRERVGYIDDTLDARINEFPVNAEILQGATMLLSGSMRWVGLVQLTALLGAMLAILGIARRTGASIRGAAFGALLFAALPVVMLQAPSALNDLVVASLVVTAAFFVLGRTRVEVGLAALATALLVGTKGTGLLALPVLLALAVSVKRGRQLAWIVTAGAAGVLVGAAWYLNNFAKSDSLFGTLGEGHRGSADALAVAVHATRYAVELFEVPGAVGRDLFLYVIGAIAILLVGIASRRPKVYAVAAALALFPLVVLPLEDVLHRAYWKGWNLVGYEQALPLGIVKDPTTASNVLSWYGPVGLVATTLALVLVARAVRRRSLPFASLVLAAAPIAFLVLVAITVTYFDLNGRFVMGGVALSAATWGVIRTRPAPAIALVAVTAITVLLALVNYNEKPAGIDLLGGLNRPSIWTLPRGWAQSIEPENAKVIVFVDDNVPLRDPIAVGRMFPYPFAYAGYPGLEHPIVYADSPQEAARRNVEWAVLPLSARCLDGWRQAFASPPWAVYRHVEGSSCGP